MSIFKRIGKKETPYKKTIKTYHKKYQKDFLAECERIINEHSQQAIRMKCNKKKAIIAAIAFALLTSIILALVYFNLL